METRNIKVAKSNAKREKAANVVGPHAIFRRRIHVNSVPYSISYKYQS